MPHMPIVDYVRKGVYIKSYNYIPIKITCNTIEKTWVIIVKFTVNYTFLF